MQSESNPQYSVRKFQGAQPTYLRHLFNSEVGWPLAPIMAWIVEEGRHIAKPADFVARLCSKLVEAGAPAWRLGLDVATIHPRFAAWQLTWARADHRVDERTTGYGIRETASYGAGPTEGIHETGAVIRYRLDRLDAALAHPFLLYLAARGGTDYVAMPIGFSTGEKNILFIATDCTEGFSELDVAKFKGSPS